MKIVLCNKYFFLNGGIERYLANFLTELPARGHEAIPFSVKYENSWESEYSSFFLPPPGGEQETHFNRIKPTPASVLRYVDRCIYSLEAKKKLNELLEHVGGADIGFILNICNYMSPSIIDVFKKRGTPVVVWFGDYHTLCPNYTFLRNHSPCVLCGKGNYYHGMVHKCVKGSMAASALRVLSMYVQRWLKLYLQAEAFIAPCNFMREKLIEGGFPAERIHVIPQTALTVPTDAGVSTGTDTASKGETPGHPRDYVLFFGRISPEKGIDSLVKAYQKLHPNVDLVLIGRSFDGHAEQLRALVKPEFSENVHIKGFMDGDELTRWVREALFTVVPSRWYDNAPFATYESYQQRTPVLAADIGGIPEQIRPGVTGELFMPDNVDDLADKMAFMLEDRQRLREMGDNAYDYVLTEVSLERHMDRMLALFESLQKG